VPLYSLGLTWILLIKRNDGSIKASAVVDVGVADD